MHGKIIKSILRTSRRISSGSCGTSTSEGDSKSAIAVSPPPVLDIFHFLIAGGRLDVGWGPFSIAIASESFFSSGLAVGAMSYFPDGNAAAASCLGGSSIMNMKCYEVKLRSGCEYPTLEVYVRAENSQS